MGKVYCIRCAKESKLKRREDGKEEVCAACYAPRHLHYRGDERGMLVKVAERGRNDWQALCQRRINDAIERGFN